MTDLSARGRLIVALDLSTVDEARALIVRLGDSVTFYKIGYQLGYAGGLALVPELANAGKKVFVDLKLHDIGNTVASGVESIAALGATFLTVHAYPQTMRAAAQAKRGELKILGVTVLTSYDDSDLADAGYGVARVGTLVAQRARQAVECGIDGIVCSAQEAEALRRTVPARMALVTPGIRPAGADVGDQKRVMTPARAIAAGATYLVVGRPIVAADDPKAAADAIVRDIEEAG